MKMGRGKSPGPPAKALLPQVSSQTGSRHLGPRAISFILIGKNV